MDIKFIPIDYDYFDFQGRNYAKIIGRDDKGKQVCLIDSFQPYLYAILKPNIAEKKIQELISKISKISIENASRITKVEKVSVEDKNFLSRKVKALKIFITNYKDGHAVADQLDYPEIESRREYDLNYITKYIIERKLLPLRGHKISGDVISNEDFPGIDNLEVDLVLRANKIQELDKEETFEPKILAFDIESDDFEIGKGEIVMISIAGKNFKKVLTHKHCPTKLDYVECFEDEGEMLEAFVKYIKKESPDMLIGYFSDGFDLPYLRARAEINKVKLKLGLDNSQPSFTRGRIPSASISGIVHVDLFRFISTVYSQYLQSETLGLNEVASELLGEGKKEFEHRHSSKIKAEDWKEYFEYNLQDSVLTYRLAEKFLPDMLEFCRIIQEPVFEITRNSMSQLVEDYILHHLQEYNEIAEKHPVYDEIGERREREKYEGAFVFQPKPGLYENIAMFDFTSMYGSVIVTHNLSRASFREVKENNTLEVDLGAKKVYFSKTPSFFSLMLKDIIEKRKQSKQEYKKQENPITKARSNGYKLLTNAAYGYQGFFGARYYCIEAAAATAALARKHIMELIEKINKEKYEVIYADTDGVAFKLNTHTKQETQKLLEEINKKLPGIMELELEDFYKRGLWVSKRTSESGAKKKYALITDKGKIKIRGFETVRRDWCQLARELQNKVISEILEQGNEKKALEILKKTLNDLKLRKIDKEEIMIRTQLKKPINEYKSITPHVIAATKMKEAGIPVDVGMMLEYFIAEVRSEKEKKLVREKVKLPDEPGLYNINYYLKHQILPAVENIFDVFNINVQELSEGKKQTSLGEF